MFIYQKTVDRSTLRQGFQIPVAFHAALKAMPGGMPMQGETRHIKILIDNQVFDAQLKNQGFDRSVYENHADVIQIRYNENSQIAHYLQFVFASTWQYVEEIKSLPQNANRKFPIKVPEDRLEYLAISATDSENIFVADCITNSQINLLRTHTTNYDELEFESFSPKEDPTASIIEKTKIQKIRHLDKSIGDSLKKLYNYRCQMTGEHCGERYEAHIVEAHHITPFTKSLNNDSTNIIILSPTYHRIIHATNPIWNQNTKAFEFPNGLVEKIQINYHL